MKRQKTDRHGRRHYRTKHESFLAVLLLALASSAEARPADALRVETLASPAPADSLTPFLAGSTEKLYLSWLERTPDGHRLRVAASDGTRFTEPVTVRASDRFFANWADFPSLLPFGRGRLAAHWLEKAGKGTYEYDVWISVSDDGGKTWGEPSKLHRDQTRSEHGFVSLVPAGEDGFAASWLDGRKFASEGSDPEMSLMFTTFQGTAFGEEMLLDGRVCECCQTAMAPTKDGFFVAYRDRSPEEIRDISHVRFDGTKWTEPRTIHDDGWHLTGCPVNGPQAAADGNRLALAWFAASHDDPRVQLVFSEDGGKSFGKPVRLDVGDAIGRVDLALVPAGAVVSWLENGGAVQARRISATGELAEAVTVARTGSDRASGFPRMAAFREHVYIAWTESYSRPGPSQVHLARLVLQ